MLKIQESAENYLETILLLQNRNGNVRSVDIANELGFSKPSICVYMKNLKNDGYINMDEHSLITLTDSGRKIAEKVYERHTLLNDALVAIGVDPKTAAEDACRIEHVISDQTFELLKQHLETHIKKSI